MLLNRSLVRACVLPAAAAAIQMPEQLFAVTPTRNPFWDVEKVMKELAEPITDAHGNEVTERVDQVIYTAKTPLPAAIRDTFELSLQIPDVEGETLVFPVIQTCEEGETAWVEVAEEGDEEPEAPAPTVAVLAAEGDGHGGGTDDEAAAEEAAAETEDEPAATEAAASDDDGGSNTLVIIGLIAGLLGLGAGGASLVQVRQKS